MHYTTLKYATFWRVEFRETVGALFPQGKQTVRNKEVSLYIKRGVSTKRGWMYYATSEFLTLKSAYEILNWPFIQTVKASELNIDYMDKISSELR